MEYPGCHRTANYPASPADLERNDKTLDFDRGSSSPGTEIASNQLVARWTKTVKLSAGVYRFSGGCDDGLRAYLDRHTEVVEDFEFAGGAVAKFGESKIS